MSAIIIHGQKHGKYNNGNDDDIYFSLNNLIGTFGCTKRNIAEILSRYVVDDESAIHDGLSGHGELLRYEDPFDEQPDTYIAKEGLSLFGKYCIEKELFVEFIEKINERTVELVLVEPFKRRRRGILRRLLSCFRRS